MLMAQKVSQQVWVGFLLVGRTHEDIDECFNYLSKQLKWKYFVLAELMKKFHGITNPFIYSKFDQEVVDFKIVIKCYVEKLVRLKKIHIFRLYMNNYNWLYFNYKNLNLIHSGCHKTMRSHVEGRWSRSSTYSQRWTTCSPRYTSLGPFSCWTSWRQRNDCWGCSCCKPKKYGICGGIRKYIEIRGNNCLKNETYCEKMEDYITCWKDVVEELDIHFPRCLANYNAVFGHHNIYYNKCKHVEHSSRG